MLQRVLLGWERLGALLGVSIMRSKIKFELRGDAVPAIHELAKITGREPEDVVSDALSTYYWVIEQQTLGNTIVAQHPTADTPKHEELELDNFVHDPQIAADYFRRHPSSL